ncbi:protein-tyrosine phosphatase-like protein [Baffinella frigidus]|nr:protein-tyrosine phosphatase-like protein [Cryptophyta sp. CCMP2293]
MIEPHEPASSSRGTDDRMEWMDWKVGHIYPVIPGQLYFTSHSTRRHTIRVSAEFSELFFFSTLEPESYRAYKEDFGPTDVASVISFCRVLRSLLHDPQLSGRPVVYHTKTGSETLSNAAFLLGAYLVIVEGLSPEDAAAPFSRIQPSPFKAFPDETELLDCLRGLARGAHAGFFALEPDQKERPPLSQGDVPQSWRCIWIAFKNSGGAKPPTPPRTTVGP